MDSIPIVANEICFRLTQCKKVVRFNIPVFNFYHPGLLQSAVITLYTVYLTWSALLYDPGKSLLKYSIEINLIQGSLLKAYFIEHIKKQDKSYSFY